MSFSKRWKIELPVAVLVLAAAGFLFYPGGRRLAGDYRLVKLGDGTSYRLQDTRQPENQLGNQGNVERIGWDDTYIVVNRAASPTTGTPWSNDAGWVVINVATHNKSATMTRSQLQQHSEIAHIPLYTPEAAYRKGHWW